MTTSSIDTSNVEADISNYFTDFHAKLHWIERNLKQKLHLKRSDCEELSQLNHQLTTQIDYIKQLLNSCKLVTEHQINVRMLFHYLKKTEEIPCHLASTDSANIEEPIRFLLIFACYLDRFKNRFYYRFVTRQDLSSIEECFDIEKLSSSEYQLVTFNNEGDLDLEVLTISSETNSAVSDMSGDFRRNFEELSTSSLQRKFTIYF